MIAPDWLSWPETQTLLAAFARHEAPIRFVGGCVRDALLGKTAQDIDAATPILPKQVLALLQAENIKAIPTGIDHGTVTAVIDGKPFEITTLRRDTSCDGRHAAVEYTTDWKEDASRRDFTINAFYLSAKGDLFDYFGGQDDLQNGVVRFIGEAGDRIQEDYLRSLRFFRFHARYGKGEPDAAALAACSQYAAQVSALSGERIQQEMLKLLATKQPSLALSFMKKTGVLEQIMPKASVETVARLEQLETKTNATPQADLRLSALACTANLSELATHWKLSNQLARKLEQVIATSEIIDPAMKKPAQKKYLRRMGKEVYVAAVKIRAARADDLSPYLSLLKLPEKWSPPEFPVTGDDLKSLGFAEGKALGDALRQLEALWEESDYKPSKARLLDKAKTLR